MKPKKQAMATAVVEVALAAKANKELHTQKELKIEKYG